MITMVRAVVNDFEALLMCNAMESVGGRPFSVVHVPAHTTERGLPMWARWHVFGQVPNEDAIRAVDEAFQRLVEEKP